MFEIVIERGSSEVQRVVVSGDVTIGRAASAQIRLDDQSVNRAHARLMVQGGQLVIADLDSANGTFVDGRRIRGTERLDAGAHIAIGPFTIRRLEARPPLVVNPALDEETGPDDAPGQSPGGRRGAPQPPRVEVLDREALARALPHVRVGRHFVFVDDAQAVMPPSGRMSRLLGYKQKKGRTVKPLADAAVEIAGARIHPAPVEIERLAGLVCDRDLYRAEQDVVRLVATMPGGGAATLRVTMNGAPFTERAIEMPKGLHVESLAMLLAGKYEAQLVIGGVVVGEPVRFTVAEYTLAPLSARLLEHKIDRAAQTLSVALAVESYAVPWDRALRAALVENGREMSEITLTLERPGRYVGKARIAGDGPFRVRVSAVDDPARVAEVALPGTRRAERQLTLAGELGKEMFVSLLPEPGAVAVRGVHISHGDFVATPVVLEEPVADKTVLRANEDLESLVVAAYDPARDGFSIFELGDVARGQTTTFEAPRPMSIAFVGCFVAGEPFEAFTSLFASERPISLEVPRTVLPGSELTVRVRTHRGTTPLTLFLCVRDERLTATDAPLTALAASAKRAIETASAGLGDEFRFAPLGELMPRPSPTAAAVARQGATRAIDGIEVVVTQRGGQPRFETLAQNEITFGRTPQSDVVLPRPNISKHHARIVLRDGKMIIVDLKSTNGTFVNGKKIGSPQVLKESDTVYIGDFTIKLTPTVSNRLAAPLSQAGAQLLSGESDEDLFDAAPPTGASLSFANADDAGDDDDAFEEESMQVAAPERRPQAARDDMDGADFEEGGGVLADLGVDDEPMPPTKGFDEKVERALEAATRELRGASINGAGAAPPVAGARAAAARAVSGKGGPGGAVEPAPVRASFPEVLFCGVVEVADGDEIRIPAGDALGAFAVEAFFVDGGDFGATSVRVQVDKPVRVDLDIATEIDPEDRVLGVLRLACHTGSARVSLLRDGRAVSLRTLDGRGVGATDALPSGSELVFDAGPGVWLATVEDPASGELDSMEVRVGAPGVYRHLAREIVLLDKGKRMQLDGDMLSLRVLPGIDEPFHMLAEATAGYQHMCCEQTAAKILSAVVMYLTTDEPALMKKAEDIILAGIARERTMFRGGAGLSASSGAASGAGLRAREHREQAGFSMYPEQSAVSDYYTPKVVQYLWSLDGLAELSGLSRQLTEAVREGLRMADDVASAWSLRRVPERVETIEDAYAVATRDPRRQRESLELVARLIAVDDKSGPRLRATSGTHRVAERATLAYAAAVLFASGKTQTAMRLANEVLKQLNEQGRLYSTVDSVAAIALMMQLRKTGIIGGAAEVVVNGKQTSAIVASTFSDQVEVIEVKEGVCVVEVTRAREERWADARSSFPLKVGFRDDAGRPLARFRRGDRAELVVSLPKGYSEGDLVHVCLPPAMAWLEGGGRVKRFTADFCGRDELRIPVVVTHAINGKQRFAVAVRNMFQEERASSPGLVTVDGA